MTSTIKQGLRHFKTILLQALSKAKELPLEDIASSFGPDIALDTVKFLKDKITEAWQIRGRKKDVMSIIDSLVVEHALTQDQETILRRIPGHFSKNDDNIRKLLAGVLTIQEYCTDILMKEGLKDKRLAEKLAKSFDNEIREILCITVNPSEIYRELQSNSELASEVLEILRIQSKYLESSTQIDLDFPIEFKPLHRFLEYHVMQHQIEKHMRNPTSKLPEPRFFRRPKTTWIDIAEGYVYYRQDIIDKIETGFNETNCQLVIGDSGSGKSTLSFILGYNRLTNLQEGNDNSHSVYYIDFIEYRGSQLTEAIRKIMDIQNRIEIYDHKVLLILDNIHVNLELAKEVFQRFASSKITDGDSPSINVDFLFLSRPFTQAEKEDTESIQGIITESETARNLLTTFTLEKREFSEAVEGIVKRYSKKQNLEISDQKIIDKLATKCSDSLWLVSFVLESIDEDSYPIDIDSIDICKLFHDYYFAIDSTTRIQGASSVFEIVLRNWPEKDSEELVRKMMRATLLTLGITGIWGTSISANFIVEILSIDGIQSDISKRFRMSDSDLLDRYNFLIDELKRLGEIVSSDDKIALPHATIANQMVRCSFSAEEEDRSGADGLEHLFQFDYLLDEKQLKMKFPFELIAIALLKFQGNQQIPITHVLADLLNKMGYNPRYTTTPTDMFIESILSYTNDLAEIFDEVYGSYSLIKVLKRSKHLGEKTPFLAEIIRKSKKPYLITHSFSDFVNLFDYDDIQTAIAYSITNTDKVDKLIDVIKQYPQVLENSAVQSAVAEIIKKPPYPWLLIGQIVGITTFLRSDRIQCSLAEVIWKSPRSRPEKIMISTVIESNPEILDLEIIHDIIAETIQRSKIVTDIIHFIGNWTILIEHEKIRQEVEEKIKLIAEAIDKSTEPWNILYLVGQWRDIQQHEVIKSVVAKKAVLIANAIKQSSEPWEIIHQIGIWEQLQNNNELIDAITYQIPRIIQALKTSPKKSVIMQKMEGWSLLKENAEIKRVYSKAISEMFWEDTRCGRLGKRHF